MKTAGVFKFLTVVHTAVVFGIGVTQLCKSCHPRAVLGNCSQLQSEFRLGYTRHKVSVDSDKTSLLSV